MSFWERFDQWLEDRMNWLRLVFPWILLGGGAILAFTTAFGGLTFNLEIGQVVGWFVSLIVVLLALAILGGFLAFIFWFLPRLLGSTAISVIIIAGAALVFINVIGGGKPVFDLEALLEPILSLIR